MQLTKRDREERAQLIQKWLSEMVPRTEILKRIKATGVDSSTASRALAAAEKDLVSVLSQTERSVMLAQMVEVLMSATHMALEQKNPGAVGSCVGQLAKLLQITD